MANENSKTQAQTIPLAKIHDLPGVFISKQPDKAYGGLVTSIQAGGVKEPVILRLREDGEYQLVTGYRRLRASELAKKQGIPALVYDMTPQEAIDYHNRVQKQPGLPIPGKLVKSPVLDGKSEKSDIKGAENPTTGTQKMDKPTEAPAPAAPTKDGKTRESPDPKAGEKSAAPVAGDKPKEAPAPAAPTKDGKAQEGPDSKAGEKPAAPVAGDKPTVAPAPAAPTKDGKAQEGPAPKAGEKPAVPVAGDKPTEAPAPAAPTKDGKTQETPGPKPGEKPDRKSVV